MSEQSFHLMMRVSRAWTVREATEEWSKFLLTKMREAEDALCDPEWGQENCVEQMEEAFSGPLRILDVEEHEQPDS
jgi:hypothetical protein